MNRFSFDERVADRYNQQRKHPPDVSQQIGAAVVAQVDQTLPVLEIGIGTGRIAHPAAAAGCHITGIDLSPQMLQQVNRKNVTALQADMHHLPFPADRFGGVLAVHVLHLAGDWQRVLREISRVLRPDGVLIQGADWIDPESCVGMLRDELRRHAVRLDPALMPPAAGISRGEYLMQLGAENTETQIAAEWVTQVSPNERLEAIEQRVDAESWILSDAIFEKMLAHLRDYAAQHWHHLDAPQTVIRRFILTISRGNWKAIKNERFR